MRNATITVVQTVIVNRRMKYAATVASSATTIRTYGFAHTAPRPLLTVRPVHLA